MMMPVQEGRRMRRRVPPRECRRSQSSRRRCVGVGSGRLSSGSAGAAPESARAVLAAARSSPVPRQNGGDGIRRRLTAEGRPTGDQLIQDAAEGPDIAACVDGQSASLLRTHVGRGTDRCPFARRPIARGYSAEMAGTESAVDSSPGLACFFAPYGHGSMFTATNSRL